MIFVIYPFSVKENYCTILTSIMLGGGYIQYISQFKKKNLKYMQSRKNRNQFCVTSKLAPCHHTGRLSSCLKEVQRIPFSLQGILLCFVFKKKRTEVSYSKHGLACLAQPMKRPKAETQKGRGLCRGEGIFQRTPPPPLFWTSRHRVTAMPWNSMSC